MKKKLISILLTTAMALTTLVMPIKTVNVVAAQNSQSTKVSFTETSIQGDYAPGKIIVSLKNGVNVSSVSSFSNIGIMGQESLMQSDSSIQSVGSNNADLVLLTLKSNKKEDMIHAINQLQNDPAVNYAEPDYVVSATEASVAASGTTSRRDPLLNKQWGLDKIDAGTAWSAIQGYGVVAAVIDTGVDYTHEDLSNMWINRGEIAGDGIDNDGNGYVDDRYGYDFVNNDGDPMDDNKHGTHVAGIIAASYNNAKGIAGVAPLSSIAALKVLGSDGRGYTSATIKALDYANKMGIKIVNLSLGGFGYSQAYYDAFAAYNGTCVCAAGNNGIDIDQTPIYPACLDLPNIICVGASDQNDNSCSFSNYGKNSVDIYAPGTNIMSTIPNNKYEALRGTSMATPFVTGAALLATAYRYNANTPELTPAELRIAIMNAMDYSANLKDKSITGGRLNVAKAADFSCYNLGMDYSPVYEYKVYARQNPDVKAHFNGSDVYLFQHFLQYGMAEGRKSSRQFDLQVYKDNNPDLVAVFGDDNKSYYMHYIQFGEAEGRKAH